MTADTKTPEEQFQQKADDIAGIMYKHSDCDDDVTWLSSDKFHLVAALTLEKHEQQTIKLNARICELEERIQHLKNCE